MGNQMNSAQRRKSKRELPYLIKLFPGINMNYFEYDDHVAEARKWCNQNCSGTYKVNAGWDHAKFKFATEKDAVIFALKWL
jgi:hypothetical protein